MKHRLYIIAFLILACVQTLSARQTHNLNKGWLFYTASERDSMRIDIPHTWNNELKGAADGYYRGTGNYIKYIDIPSQWRGKRIFVKFNGASTVTELMVNGRYAGCHKGGNNAFVFEITDLVEFSQRNLLWVLVSNSFRTDVLPTAGAEKIYGGIFRDVELIVTDPNAIGFGAPYSDGVLIQTLKVTEESAECRVKVTLNSAAAASGTVTVRLKDRDGKTTADNAVAVKLKKGVSEVTIPLKIDKPMLWNGTKNPYLYTFHVEFSCETGSLDSVKVKSGLRTIKIDNANGFLLNGEKYPLRGVVLHRDRAIYGSVSAPWQTDSDLDIIQEMGANAIRVACGTYSQHFYDECDRRGIIVVNDSPLVGAVNLNSKGYYNTEDFKANARLQLTEMVSQNLNHPCIAAWNIFVEPELTGDDPLPLIRELITVCRTLDPSRPTSGCSSRDGDINKATDLIIWNHVLGWASGFAKDIALWRDLLFANSQWNKLVSAISYRCGGSVTDQGERPALVTASDNRHPESYQTYFHETYFREVASDSRFWAVFVGDIFDFASAAKPQSGLQTSIDDCGLVTYDRAVRKDAYYLYKANWNDQQPFVYITERRFGSRPCHISELHVYSNADEEVELFINGISQGAEIGSDGIFMWKNLELNEGENEIKAVSGELSDSYIVIGLPTGSIIL